MLKEDEEFWDTVIAWFCKQHMFDMNNVRPLVDYINHRRTREIAMKDAGNLPDDHKMFSMKGRTAEALVRDMLEWHDALNQERKIKASKFEASGVAQDARYSIEYRDHGKTKYRHWDFNEIHTSKDLAAEGKAMSHCVSSYGYSISKGRVSIWSLKLEGDRAITIEVVNSTKRIVQARGKYNRKTTKAEDSIIEHWANKNGLKVDVRYLW